jgi:hypothetical protein
MSCWGNGAEYAFLILAGILQDFTTSEVPVAEHGEGNSCRAALWGGGWA